MTVYVTGDIHGGLDMQKLRDWELGDSLGSDDYLIIAGDFGFPWDFSAEECADIAWMESRPYTVLFVDGNHERRQGVPHPVQLVVAAGAPGRARFRCRTGEARRGRLEGRLRHHPYLLDAHALADALPGPRLGAS